MVRGGADSQVSACAPAAPLGALPIAAAAVAPRRWVRGEHRRPSVHPRELISRSSNSCSRTNNSGSSGGDGVMGTLPLYYTSSSCPAAVVAAAAAGTQEAADAATAEAAPAGLPPLSASRQNLLPGKTSRAKEQ